MSELTVKQMAKREQVSERTVRRWIKRELVQSEKRINRIAITVPEDDIAPATREGYDWTWFSGVYFIKCESFIKIGLAQDVRLRLRGVQSHNPLEVIPLGFIPCQSSEGAHRLEREIHTRFGPLRFRHEWFRDESSLREFIASECSPWPAPKHTMAREGAA